MKKYQIELDENQVKLLQNACDTIARIKVGQIGQYSVLSEILFEARKKHFGDNQRELIESRLNELKKLCFDQVSNQNFGIRYSEETDALIDISEVLRHQLYLSRGETQKVTLDAYPAEHWNKKQPLIKISEKL